MIEGGLSKVLNTTFLMLIPKKSSAEDLKDFTPISLVGNLYKILAKILAKRPKKVILKREDKFFIWFLYD